MLKKRALRKIIITTFSFLTILVICIIPEELNYNTDLDTNIEIEYVSNLKTTDIYLLGTNNYLIKVSVLLEDDDLTNNIKEIINYLTIDKSNKIPKGLNGIIPKNTILNEVSINEKIATLDFSSELLNISSKLEERLIEAITYSVINLDNIEGITIKIDGNTLTELPNSKKTIPEILKRDFGINKVFDIDSLNNIQKVTLYYIDKINDESYYVPVTKYLNDDREKINIIIDNLSSSYIYESSLISLLNQDTELINYEIDESIMRLTFSNSIFTNDKLLEEVTYTIKESVCATYDIESVILMVEGSSIEEVNECYQEL